MSEDYIYAVTRVHAREIGLLGKNDLERLLACPDEKACLQVLPRRLSGLPETSKRNSHTGSGTDKAAVRPPV